MKKTIDSLLSCRWLIPIEPHNSVLENHAIAIDAGRIIDILPNEIAKQNYLAKKNWDLAQHAVLPGLINCHTHSPMTLLRGFADDLSLMNWLNNYIWPAEKKWMSDQFCYDGTLLAILEMLRSGTTCFNENYFHTHAIGEAAHLANMRAVLGSTIIDFPSLYAQTSDDYIARVTELYQHWNKHPLISVTAAPQGPYSVSDETFHKIRKLTEQYPVKIHLHLHETDDEIQQGLQQYHKRPIQRMFDLGLLSERTQCIHMTQITPEDILLLQKTKAQVVHCPQSNLKLASGFAPVKKFMDAGINVALGTDGAASNNDLDMFNEMQTAALLAKAVAKDPTALTAADALKMATLNGAKLLGLEKEIGSVEIGKAADLIAVDLLYLNTQPIYHPISNLVYAINSQQVTHSWVAGKCLYDNKKFTNLDENAIIERSLQWSHKIFKH